MTVLSSAVRHALLGSDMGAVANDIKHLLSEEFRRVDPSAEIHSTEYFNHSYIPDLVVAWGKERREVFLRFLNSADALRDDANRLGRSAPLLFDLSRAVEERPNTESVLSALNDDVPDISPGLLVTDTEATVHIRPHADSNLVERIYLSSVLRGGRGHLSEAVAKTTMTAARESFGAAINLEAGPLSAAVEALSDLLAPEMERRIEKTLQLLWWAGGGRPQEFPSTVLDDMELDPGDTRDFLRLLFTDELAIEDGDFWGRLADRVDFDALVEVGDVDSSGNLDRLMAELSKRLRVGHVVIDQRDRPFPPYDELAWRIRDRFLCLSGPDWILSFADQGGRFSQRSASTGDAIRLAEVHGRTGGLVVEEAEIEESRRRVQLSLKPADHDDRRNRTLSDLTEGFPDAAVVRKLVVAAREVRFTAEWDRMMVSSTPDATVQRLAHVAVSLLVAPPEQELDELTSFLRI